VLPAERHETILARLARDGTVVSSTLVAELGVSDDTLRRDLRELAGRGLLRQVHGGAMPLVTATSFAERLDVDADAKAALAVAALPLVADADLLVLDGGTTTLELARRLPPSFAGTVLTNSPPIAVALAAHPRAGVMQLGGPLDKESLVTYGLDTLDMLRSARSGVCVLGVCSVDPELGVTATDRQQAEVKRTMVAGARTVIALATADKLGTAAAWAVAPIAALEHLVTDAPEEATAAYTAAGIAVRRP